MCCPFVTGICKQFSTLVKEEGVTGGKSYVKEVRVPWDKVMPVKDVWIRVVPSPMYKFYGHNVVGEVN